jgi:hypothetical protein
MDGIGMGNPKAKLTPARAGGSERNASPAITKARTTSFFILKETRKIYPRIQETARGADSGREGQCLVDQGYLRANLRAQAFRLPGRAASASPADCLCCDQARRLMAHDGYNAITAARAVATRAYRSSAGSFKRLFGVTPLRGARTRQLASRPVNGARAPNGT